MCGLRRGTIRTNLWVIAQNMLPKLHLFPPKGRDKRDACACITSLDHTSKMGVIFASTISKCLARLTIPEKG